MYTIKTENNSIECTDKHPVAVKYKSRILFKSAMDINIGDKVLVSNDYHESLDKDWRLGWLLGFMDGDGVYDKQNTIDRCFVAQNDIKLLEFAQEVCKENGATPTNIWKNGERNHRFGILGN